MICSEITYARCHLRMLQSQQHTLMKLMFYTDAQAFFDAKTRTRTVICYWISN